MNSSSNTTMKEVAERAGVSLMTVSLALRPDSQTSRLSPETRNRVRQVARDLRYRPNARGRALRSGQTNVIGLYAGYGFINVRLPFFAEVVSGLQEGCEAFQKDLLVHGTFHGSTAEDIFTEIADGRIDGVVVQMSGEDPVAKRLAEAHLPVVALADPIAGIPSITVDDASGSRMLFEHLRSRGYRRFLYLSIGIPALSAIRRRDAFFAAADTGSTGDAGNKVRLEEIQLASSADADAQLIQCLLSLELSSGPSSERTAIVCWNDFTAYKVLSYCRVHGLRVPEDVAVVGFDGYRTPLDGVWSLTTIRAPWAQAARLAVEYLNSLIEGNTDVPMENVLPVELVTGDTA
jgi:DNA-binding LacI/PurR family transcriptional regulator